jgi:agmatine deiminase
VFEPVTVAIRAGQSEAARKLLPEPIALLEVPVDDCWTRDTGPIFLSNGQGGLAAIVPTFNVWGEKFPGYYGNDRQFARRIADDMANESFAAPIVLEGGALMFDGEGTLVTTESAILNENRNPGMTKDDAEAIFRDAFGIEKTIWLPGTLAETVTDGHIDGFMAYVRPGVALVELPVDPSDGDYQDQRENLKALQAATDAKGRTIEYGLLERPRVYSATSDWFCNCYVNFYIANGGVVMPEFGDAAADDKAEATIAAAFPDRRIRRVRLDALADGGGGIHCITRQIPA